MQWFFYGTLLDSDVRSHVFPHVADSLELTPALLRGHVRVRCRGRSYPVVVPRAGCRVSGMLVRGLDERAVLRVAHFEGPEYMPRRVPLLMSDGAREEAWLFMPRSLSLATREPWSYERWVRLEKRCLMPQVRFWMGQCGAETAASPELRPHVRRQLRAIAASARPLPPEPYRLAA